MNDKTRMMRWSWLALLLASCTCERTVVAGEESGVPFACQPATCEATAATCGPVSDGCGGTLRCGVCADGLVCGGSGKANACAPYCNGKWCWQNPLPQGNTLYDVWRSPSGALWVVGLEGTVLRHDGEQWHRVPSPTPSAYLKSIWGTAEDDLWAGGLDGAWHWDGSTWTAVSTPHSALYSIRGLSPDDLWGLDGQEIVHWDGRAWTAVKQTGTTLWALWVNAPNDVWAVGSFGVVLRWDGALWAQVPGLPLTHHLSAISGTGANDVWVVGFQSDTTGSASSLVEHWDGLQWEVVSTPGWPATNDAPGFSAVLALASDDVWVAGPNGTVLQWDGLGWQVVPTGTGANLMQIIGTDRDHVWVAGGGGTLAEWSAGAWRFLGGKGAYMLNSIWGSSPANIWVSGWYGAALHWDGKGWTDAVGLNRPRPDRGTPGTLPSLAHYALWGSGRDDVWSADRVAFGPAELQHFDGVSWSPGKVGPALNQPFAIRAGCSISPTDGWMVGTTVMQLNGGSWAERAGPWPDLSDVSCRSSTDVWAVGSTAGPPQQGQVLHWDGAGWVVVHTSSSATFEHVWAAAQNDVWVTGTSSGRGIILHWDGMTWSTLDWTIAVASSDINDANAQFTSVTGGPGEVLFTSNLGFLVRWDGLVWARERTGKNGFLSRLWRTSNGELWASGFDGAILHREAQ